MEKVKTFVVNMEKDVDKRNAITAYLSSTPELEWSFFSACEGRSLSEEALKTYGYPYFKSKYGRFGTLPAFGCAVSHYNIYKQASETETLPICILEDDAILKSTSGSVILSVARWLSENEEPAAVLLTPDFRYDISSDRKFISGSRDKFYIYPTVNAYMTSGYLLNRGGYNELAKHLFPIHHVADDWMAFAEFGIKVYGIVPHIISYPDGMGEIGRSQRPVNEPILLILRHIAGRLKARIYGMIEYAKGIRRSKKQW